MPLCFYLLFVCNRTLPVGLPKTEFTGAASRPIATRRGNCFINLIIASFPYLCLFVYICSCVYRVFPHLESRLFSFGPIPMLCDFFSPPCSSRLPSSSLSCCFLLRARQKVGLCIGARELAPNLLCLWGLALVCRLKRGWILCGRTLESSLMIEYNKMYEGEGGGHMQVSRCRSFNPRGGERRGNEGL